MKIIPLKSYGLLTILEAAAKIAANPQTIRNRIADGSLPGVLVPGHRESYLIREADLKKMKKPQLGRPKKGK